MPRRNPIFERGRDLHVENDRYRPLHLGPDRGAAIGEYSRPDASEYSDSYYSPPNDYRGSDFARENYRRGNEEPAAKARSFYGRGPKGYRRSDQRLLEIICQRLTDDAHIDASDIHLDAHDGLVLLTGTVADKNVKWRVEYLVESISGVTGVDNRLRC